MSRIVVLGSAGFLGSHLCDALIERGDEVVGIDDLSTGRLQNIAHLLNTKNFSFEQRNIVDGCSISGRVDAVLNFASPASPDRYMETPLHTLRTGSAGTDNALRLAAERGSRFIMASTSEVYGEPLIHPQHEEYWGNVNPIGKRSCYDEAKRYSEALCMAYKKEFSVDVGIARIFNTYGPRLSPGDGRVVSNFITQGLANQPLTIYGDGQQTRSFCFVEDQVKGILSLLDSNEVGPINIGSTEECTMLQLANVVLSATKSKAGIVFKPKPEDDPSHRKPDISKANSLLGWKPTVDLSLGIEMTVSWFRDIE